MQFKQVGGDMNWVAYNGLFQSKKLNNGEFDYWLFIKFDNVEDYNDFDCNYIAELMVVAPGEVDAKTLESAFSSSDFNSWGDKNDPAMVALVLAEDGVGASLWNDEGNNYKKLMKAARREANMANSFFGFYMDRPQNALGSDGWDFIKGDMLAGLYK